MKRACKNCHSLYEETKQRSDCPHKEFPQPCEIHKRTNCGNRECNNGKVLELVREEKEGNYGVR